jgi:CubicO group peptidase (beta-lactamase class C family)
VVEVVSGMPYDRFLKTRLFDPLGMKDTTFWISKAQEKRLAASYRRNAGKLEPAVITYMYGGAVTDRQRAPTGGAGLFSTAEDVARVYQMMLNGGVYKDRRLLKAETVTVLTTKHTGSLVARPGMPWGYGFSIIEDPSQMEANGAYTPGTFGHGGAFGTGSWADPKTGTIHIFMIQRAGISGNPDNSAMRRAYEAGVAAGLTP